MKEFFLVIIGINIGAALEYYFELSKIIRKG